MPLCGSQNCGCAITSESLTVSGNGTPESPWVLETVDPIDLAELEDDLEAIEATLAALAATYVNTSGDTMTGALNILSVTGASLQLRRGDAESPYINFYTSDNASRIAYIQASDTGGLIYNSEIGDIHRFYTSGVERIRILATGHMVGAKIAVDTTDAGWELHPAGTIIATRTDSAATSALILNKAGTGGGTSASFAEFRLNNTEIGSVTRSGATSAVLYNTTSDARLKTVIEDLDPELAEYIARLVTPVMHTWNDDPESKVMAGYIAQQVAEVWPGAVDCGLVTPGDDDNPWQMDKTTFIPVLHAAWQSSANKLDALTARVEALENP